MQHRLKKEKKNIPIGLYFDGRVLLDSFFEFAGFLLLGKPSYKINNEKINGEVCDLSQGHW